VLTCRIYPRSQLPYQDDCRILEVQRENKWSLWSRTINVSSYPRHRASAKLCRSCSIPKGPARTNRVRAESKRRWSVPAARENVNQVSHAIHLLDTNVILRF